MIEIELKYKIAAAPSGISEYPLIAEKSQTDVYYDAADCRGIKSGNFLRIRDGRRLDFKLNIDDFTHTACKELNFPSSDFPEKSGEINKPLALFCAPAADSYSGIDDIIVKNNLIVLGRVEKHRREYKITDTITIAIDDVKDIGVFLECETTLSFETDQSTVEKHKDEMIAELSRRGLLPPDARRIHTGYLELYLREHNREIYETGIYKDY